MGDKSEMESVANDEDDYQKSIEGPYSQNDYDEDDKFKDVKSGDSSFEMYWALDSKNEQPVSSEVSAGFFNEGTSDILSPL